MLVISAALDLDLNIAAERAHEAEQPLKGEAIEAPAQQIGNVGLTDSHPLGRSPDVDISAITGDPMLGGSAQCRPGRPHVAPIMRANV